VVDVPQDELVRRHWYALRLSGHSMTGCHTVR
jgi:hypothetical protein